MKSSKSFKCRAGSRVNVEQVSSTPEIRSDKHDPRRTSDRDHDTSAKLAEYSVSEANLSARRESGVEERVDVSPAWADMPAESPRRAPAREGHRTQCRPDKCHKHKKHGTVPPEPLSEDSVTRQMREIHNDTRKSARIIRDSRSRLLEIQKKPVLTESDIRELGDRNELLLREMERFDKLTRSVQRLVGANNVEVRRQKDDLPTSDGAFFSGSIYGEEDAEYIRQIN